MSNSAASAASSDYVKFQALIIDSSPPLAQPPFAVAVLAADLVTAFFLLFLAALAAKISQNLGLCQISDSGRVRDFDYLLAAPAAKNCEKMAVIQSATSTASTKGGCAGSRLDHDLKVYVIQGGKWVTTFEKSLDLSVGCLDLSLGAWNCLLGAWTCLLGAWTCLSDAWTCLLGALTSLLCACHGLQGLFLFHGR